MHYDQRQIILYLSLNHIWPVIAHIKHQSKHINLCMMPDQLEHMIDQDKSAGSTNTSTIQSNKISLPRAHHL